MKLLTKHQISLGYMIFSSNIRPSAASVNVQMTLPKAWSDFTDQLKLCRICLPDKKII